MCIRDRIMTYRQIVRYIFYCFDFFIISFSSFKMERFRRRNIFTFYSLKHLNAINYSGTVFGSGSYRDTSTTYEINESLIPRRSNI